MKIRVIVNRGGGTLKGSGDEEQRIVAAFEAAGVDADVRMTDPADIFEALKTAAAAPGLDAVVAGGGDGTLSCAAGHLADTGRAFGILPLGTLNHLARDAGIPANIEEAAKVIAAGHIREIDVAEVNGRVFVNNSAVGLYPDMVMLRELEQEKFGRS
jgi:diacylglycerol kinase family enzyme